MTRRRFASWAAALLLAGLGSQPALGGDQPSSQQTLMLVRTTQGPASFTLTIDAGLGSSSPRGFDAQVTARVVDDKVVRAAALGVNALYFDYGITASSGGSTVQVCQPLGGCVVNRTLAYRVETSSSDRGGPNVDNRLYVALEGPVEVSFKGQGWELRRLPTTYRYVEAADAGPGVQTGSQGLTRLDAATARGGSAGSIAVGAPPCSTATPAGGSAAIPRGTGTATLTGGGGGQPSTLTCPDNVGKPYITAVSNGPASWTLTGPVTGDSTGLNVPLFVLDLPDRP